jgi:DNA-binding MarR family transcriptional regulator
MSLSAAPGDRRRVTQGGTDLPRPRIARVSVNESSGVNYGELADSVGFLLRRAQLSVVGHLIGVLAPLELRPAQFSVLALIEANPDLGQSELCEALGIQRPNFVAMLDELESRGLTKRRPSRLDRRIKTLVLTPKGTRVFRRAVTVHAAHEARLLRLLGAAGRSQFESLLQRLVEPD